LLHGVLIERPVGARWWESMSGQEAADVV
jgi:hypothetical protein